MLERSRLAYALLAAVGLVLLVRLLRRAAGELPSVLVTGLALLGLGLVLLAVRRRWDRQP